MTGTTTGTLDPATATPEQLLTRANGLRGTLLERGDRLRELRERDPKQRSDNWQSDTKVSRCPGQAASVSFTATAVTT